LVPERINQTARTPTVFLVDGGDLGRTSGKSSSMRGVGIIDVDDHAYRASRVEVGWQLVVLLHPELRIMHSELSYLNESIRFHRLSHRGREGPLVKPDCG